MTAPPRRAALISAAGQLGGAERVLLDLAAQLQHRGRWQPHVVSMAGGPLVEALTAAGVPVTVLALPPALSAMGEAGRSPLALAWSVARRAPALRSYAAAMRDTLRGLRPDIVHANGIKPSLVAAMCVPAGAALIWHLHDYPGTRPASARMMRWLGGRASLVLATSESLAGEARRLLPTASVEAVLNGIDVGHFAADGPREDLDARSNLEPARPGTIRIGLLATYARWKGHDVFLDALARLPPDAAWRGYVIGAPVYQTAGSQFSRQQLDTIAGARGLSGRVGFTGFVPDSAAALRALDIVVHASTAPEPFGLVLAEAMASGRALVTTATGGSAELVLPDRTALVVAPGDAGALADAIGRLAGDPGLRRRLGDAGRAHASAAFTRDRFAAAVESCYTRLAGAGPAGVGRAG